MPSNSTELPVNPVNAPPGHEQEQPRDGIALCLSGGGYRAMMFHVGVLWRLNEAGLLRKLDRVSSVSGGSITAGALGLLWKQLQFDGAGVAQNLNIVFDAIGRLAARTIDAGSVIFGSLLPGVSIGEKVAEAYRKYLFGKATLQDLPADGQGPRFVLNATNVQTGSLWRFSRPYMGDWQVGLVRNAPVPLAQAVAASSAFPPVLSPVVLDVSPEDFDPATRGKKFELPFNDTVVLSDGGVYDNLGLETAVKSYSTLLVSDAGQKMGFDPYPKSDWARHAVRVMGLIDNQVRSLRKRQLMDLFLRGVRGGAYWGIGNTFADFANGPGGANPLTDPLKLAKFDPEKLAGEPTRLEAMDPGKQQRLINWGYAASDTALRKYAAQALSAKHGVTLRDPRGLPYPNQWP